METIENKIAILGLDKVGKTTLIRRLFNFDRLLVEPPSTHGIEVTDVILEKNHEQLPIMIIDVGGLKVFQVTLWEDLISSDIKAIMYVVDILSSERLDSDLNAFSIVANKTTVPILVLGNKYDVKNDHDEINLTSNHLFEILDIVEHQINNPFREINVLPISVKTGLNIDLISDWLYKIVKKGVRK